MTDDAAKPETQGASKPLDEVLLAMDVVDTLRHREQLVMRELDQEGREAELIERLKEIYKAQGIDVPERILKDGVKALEENRFVYQPPQNSLAVRAAKLYVSRDAWFRPVAAAFVSVFALFGVWQVGVVGPQKARAEQERVELTQTLPTQLEQLRVEAQELAVEERGDTLAETYYQDGVDAIAEENAAFAKIATVELQTLIDDLEASYEVRVVYGPDEPRSGVFRIPNDAPNVRNYYLIVEAVDAAGRNIEVPVISEEDQSFERVKKWGLRVSEEAFYNVADDKEDDQIIQKAVIGAKKQGYLTPDYSIDTDGGVIFKW